MLLSRAPHTMKPEAEPASDVSEAVRDYYARKARFLRSLPEEAGSQGADADFDLGETICTPLGCGDSIGLASLRPGEVVLDLGSGAGLDVLRSARQVSPEGFVYGLEMTDEMLAVAHDNASAYRVENTTFLKGQIEDIPLPDSSIDVIVSNCVINLSVDKEKALSEAYRVLRPGGRFAVADIVVDGGFDGLFLSEECIRSLLKWTWTRCIAGALTVDEYQQKLAEAGFTEVDVRLQEHYTVKSVLERAGAMAARFERVGAMAARFGTVATFLTPAGIRRVVGRFAAGGITAKRPFP